MCAPECTFPLLLYHAKLKYFNAHAQRILLPIELIALIKYFAVHFLNYMAFHEMINTWGDIYYILESMFVIYFNVTCVARIRLKIVLMTQISQ